MRQGVAISALAAGLLAAPLLPAQQPKPAAVAVDSILHTVDQHYNHLATLKAHYTEHYTGLGMDRTETGTLLLKKPGRMRWNSSTPAGKVFVLDGKYAWSYTPGDAQAQRVSAKKLDDLRSPLRFLLGHTELRRELGGITVIPAGSLLRISGAPRGMQQRVKSLTLLVTPAGVIQSLEIEEIDGATTEFTFSDVEEGLPVPNSEFTFTPPAGVAVVDGPPPV